MDERYVALAIPVFFVSIVIELFVNLRRGDARYRLHDTLANLSCGVGQRVFGLALDVAALLLYSAVFTKLRVFTLSPGAASTWVLAVLLVDLCFYAFHRASHRVNAFWAAHAVHHQSQEYNLSAALRQSWLEPAISPWFYLPLALLGVPPAVFLVVSTSNTLYQFFTHTRAVKSLGPLEWVLNTPSHHRVHHGIDPAYIDKNYGGMFIVWDRLFGTFEPEAREPYYGTVKPLGSFSAYYANAIEWARIATLARGAGSLAERLYAPVAPPEWRPAALGGTDKVPPVDPLTYARFETRVARAVDVYATTQFVFVVLTAALLLWFHGALSPALAVACGAWIMAGVASVGALIEGRHLGRYVEHLRFVSLPALTGWLALEAHAPLRARVFLAVSAALVGFALDQWLTRATEGLSVTYAKIPDASRITSFEDERSAA